MNVAGFSARDWLIFLGPYLGWCAVSALVWRVRALRSAGLRRAVWFALLFTPSPCPVVREAFVIAPLVLSVGWIGVLAGLQWRHTGTAPGALGLIVRACVIPFLVVLAGYSVLRLGRARRV